MLIKNIVVEGGGGQDTYSDGICPFLRLCQNDILLNFALKQS